MCRQECSRKAGKRGSSSAGREWKERTRERMLAGDRREKFEIMSHKDAMHTMHRPAYAAGSLHMLQKW